MNAMPKSIVVSYSLRDEAFHRESLLEYTQGNALRLLKNHPVHYHAIAVVETDEEAERAIFAFSRQQRVSAGMDDPVLTRPRAVSVATVSRLRTS